MEPIQVRISKAKTVPATNSRYEQRTEWKFVYKITYSESEQIFKHIGDSSRGLQIETDAQFAKWLVDKFGHGRYHLHIFKRRVSGWTFYNFNCESSNKFFQVKKEKTAKERQEEELVQDFKRKSKELEQAETDEEKESIKEEIEDITDNLEIRDILDDEENKRGKVKIRPFKNTMPLYKQHEYENYGVEEELNGIDNRIW